MFMRCGGNRVGSILAGLLALALAGGTPAARAAFRSPQMTALDELRAASSAPVEVHFQRGFPHSVLMRVPASGADPLEQALGFLARYGDLYLLSVPGVEIVPTRADDDGEGGTVVRFAQKFAGLWVFGAEMNVHISSGAAGIQPCVTETAGSLVVPALVDRTPPVVIAPDLDPALPPEEAEESARAALGLPGATRRGETVLMLYSPGVYDLDPPSLGDSRFPPDPVLVYRVSLETQDGSRQALIDADTGQLVFGRGLSKSGVASAGYDLRVWDYNGNPLAWPNPSSTQIGDESGIQSTYNGIPDAVAAFQRAGQTWQAYHDLFGRHGHDDDSGLLDVNIRVALPTAPNASAGGNGGNDVSFSPGVVSLDIMTHEFSHLVINQTSDLTYSGESGALDEAFADIMGVVVDSADWLIGEATTGMVYPGGLRNVANPPSSARLCGTQNTPYICPDHMSRFWQTTEDDGGVHTNSSIVNKAFFFMSEGNQFGQVPIPIGGMGRHKMAWLAYRTFTLLPKNATFQQASWAFINKAGSWVNNQHNFTYADRCDVHNALAAVGLRLPDFDCDGVEDDATDSDGDGIYDDGDGSGIAGDDPCGSFQSHLCDDNCRTTANPNQFDYDGDLIGDACDGDLDGDGFPDGLDPCPGIPNDFPDWDHDGIPNCLDPDDDDDGIPDDGNYDGNPYSLPCASGQTTGCDDNCRGDANPTQLDGNGNGFGDACDPDQDGDGFYVESDNCTFVFNPSQADGDADGLGDACDKCPGVPDNSNAYTPGMFGQPPQPYQPDFDGDGIPDACDPRPYGTVGAHIGGNIASNFNPIRRDGMSRSADFFGEVGAGHVGRLPMPGCDGGVPRVDELYELVLTGLPGTLEAWVENGDGRVLQRARTSHVDPADRGFRFRPRCDEETWLFLRTASGWNGAASFTIRAGLVPSSTPHPWGTPEGGFGEVPPPLPDRDDDEILDAVDNCPATWDPTGVDTDGDGPGDVCDVCPSVYNPDQSPVAFETIRATSASALSWTTPVDHDHVWGPLSALAAYEVEGSGSATQSDSFVLPAGVSDAWFLFKRTDCGTWGSSARDQALP